MSLVTKAVYIIASDVIKAAKRELGFYMSKPTVGTLFLTNRCTSRCNTCTRWKMPSGEEKELKLSDWKKAVEILYDNGVRNFELFGGDVLLRTDVLIPLIRYLKSKCCIVHIPTNTILLNQKMATDLVKTEVDFLYLSTDGVGNVHDKIRGVEGTFDQVSRAISFLVKARGNKKLPRLICNTTVSKYNIDSLEEIPRYAAKMGFDAIFFEYVGEVSREHINNSLIDGLRPNPYYVKQKDSVLLNEEQAISLKTKLKKIKDQYSNSKLDIVTLNVDSLSVENLYKGTIPNKKCYVEKTQTTIDPYGNLVACLFVNNYVLGNILRDDFSDIWNNAAHLKFREYQSSGKIALCEHCILGVQRNHSFFMALKRNLFYGHNWGNRFLQSFRAKK